MKKIIIILWTCCYALSLYSQSESKPIESFFLTANGTILTNDQKDYFVIDCERKSQEALYNDFLVAITKLYTSPKTVVDKVENRIITIKGYEAHAFSVDTEKKALDKTTIKNSYAVKYTLQFQFKEGKVRIDRPVINSIAKLLFGGVPGAAYEMPLWVSTEKLFIKEIPELTGKQNKDEKNKEKADRHNRVKDKTISAVNDFFNNLIKMIVDNALKSGNDSEW